MRLVLANQKRSRSLDLDELRFCPPNLVFGDTFLTIFEFSIKFVSSAVEGVNGALQSAGRSAQRSDLLSSWSPSLARGR
jgi:hypothetical protein